MLEAECGAAGVRIETGLPGARDHGWGRRVRRWRRRAGRDSGESLVIATGGLSIPKIGATPFGYQVARQFGIGIVECRPALVPLTFGREDRERFADLTGVSAEVTARAGGARVSREAAVHPPRAERAGDPAGVVLLATGGGGGDRPAARSGSAGSAARVRGRRCGRWPAGSCPSGWRSAGARCKAISGPAMGLSDREMRAIAEGLHGWRVHSGGHGGLREGRSHGGRRGHGGAIVEDDGVPEGAGTVLHRRGGGRHRAPGRLQLSVGLGERGGGGAISVRFLVDSRQILAGRFSWR